ncbi:MAG: nucleotidyltransferase domain-containing protein [Prolixibacteraceae bacterium]|nr:nucleotidyltransferase domain-containing protein [Prolixibacteraceae bacterium]
MIDLVGLRQKDIEIIVSVIQTHPEVTEACLFGSRAKGNFRTGSDVDLALKGDKLTTEIVSSISYQLNEETTLPYKFDVLNYNSISNNDLKEHIDRIGIRLFPIKNQ